MSRFRYTAAAPVINCSSRSYKPFISVMTLGLGVLEAIILIYAPANVMHYAKALAFANSKISKSI